MKVVDGKFGKQKDSKTPLVDLLMEGFADNGITEQTTGKMFVVIQADEEGFDTMLSNMTVEEIIYTLEIIKHNIINATSYLSHGDLH